MKNVKKIIKKRTHMQFDVSYTKLKEYYALKGNKYCDNFKCF